MGFGSTGFSLWVLVHVRTNPHRLNRLRKKYVCHSERSEESLRAMDLNRREILRFAQNDTKTDFFRSLVSLRAPASRQIIHASKFHPKEKGPTPVTGSAPFFSEMTAHVTARPICRCARHTSW